MLPLVLALAIYPQPSVCDVFKKPAAFLGHLVQIRGKVLSAIPHGALLLDKNCSHRGIQLGIDLPDADSSATNLMTSILNDCPVSQKPDGVEGLFIGKLTYSKGGRIQLRLKSVDELQVGPCTMPQGP